jgi:hypothetical protein
MLEGVLLDSLQFADPIKCKNLYSNNTQEYLLMNKLSHKPERGIPIPAKVEWIRTRIVHMVHPSPGRQGSMAA